MKRILFHSYQPGEDSVIVEMTDEEFTRMNQYTVEQLENVIMSDKDSEWLNEVYCQGRKVLFNNMYDLPIDLEIPRT